MNGMKDFKMTKPTLTLEIKNVYGRLCAYPKDTFLTALLALKDEVSKTGTRKKAKCFMAPDMPALKTIADLVGADLIEENLLKGEALICWKATQIDRLS